MNNGRLVYVTGASGAGKDTLCSEARAVLNGTAPVLFAHRYITRPADAGGENHVALTREEFYQRRELGLFAMSWESHGNGYGIGAEIDRWLEKGVSVVVNGSRGYLAEAARRYPEMVVIHIEVDREVLKERLLVRNRETEVEIEARLNRSDRLPAVRHKNLCTLYNNDSLEASVSCFVEVLESLLPEPYVLLEA
ncbi:phosphonate metabolism protein/1,5-bisphosphokinase (PRPP-forming) PhnN [Desulfoluna spongiiphila]|uniref:Ribose 1,5-bisphosphate phosphokinase PhnN n=1 Tax=Desulfoluna spongiiphila TaxID=419481 RepID=A0A1G5DXR7_9BACT|nr:phosphonate metabolism protein/1,5-bisphosphokinase (PRPP-forming) PhnN [Desulfoluna spongiiphila]SCY19310.1 ribose 1,5-bisphosphokinase [Desulfoluna spongiiphila]VVS91472.1 guanylate kinase/l-type calcium channel beta subunit [Desulfoluna spongiiphila]